MLTKFFQRPDKIDNSESAILPIRDRLIGAQSVHIDRDVNVVPGDLPNESLIMLAPIAAQNCAAPMSILRAAIIGPRMHLELAFYFGATISQKLTRPPAFEIAAAPDAHAADMRQFERAINPRAARPARRRDRPIRMIIKGNQRNRLRLAAKPERGQMMKIARAVKDERRDA